MFKRSSLRSKEVVRFHTDQGTSGLKKESIWIGVVSESPRGDGKVACFTQIENDGVLDFFPPALLLNQSTQIVRNVGGIHDPRANRLGHTTMFNNARGGCPRSQTHAVVARSPANLVFSDILSSCGKPLC